MNIYIHEYSSILKYIQMAQMIPLFLAEDVENSSMASFAARSTLEKMEVFPLNYS